MIIFYLNKKPIISNYEMNLNIPFRYTRDDKKITSVVELYSLKKLRILQY